MKKNASLILSFILSFVSLSAQIGINTVREHPAVLLDVNYKGSPLGVLLPHMSTAQRDSIAVDPRLSIGLTIFNITTHCFEVYTGGGGAHANWYNYCDPTQLNDLRIGVGTPAAAAILQIDSKTKGVLLPRMDTDRRNGIQGPALGLTIFNLDSLCFEVYVGNGLARADDKGWDDYCHQQRLDSLLIGSGVASSAAILSISATDRGVLLPRMDTDHRNSIQKPLLGLTIFNTDSLCYEVYVGTNQLKWADSKGWDNYCVRTYHDSLLIGQGSLSSSAVLEVRSTSKGVLLPRMDTGQRNGIQDPKSGLTIFNTDSLCYEVYLESKGWDDYCKPRDPKLASLRIGTNSLASSAIVSVSSTAKGVLLPRMTTAQRNGIQDPKSGLTIFNLDSLCYQVYLNVKGWDNYCHRQQLHSLVVGSGSLDPSATLDVSSTAKGFLFPRVTTAQRDDIQGKVLALTVFNTDSACYEVYLGVDQPKWSDSKGWDDYCVQTYYDSLLIGQGSLSPSAVLEVRSTSKGVLFPRMTTAQRNGIQDPESGLTIFNLDSLCYEVYRGTAVQPPWDDYCKRKDPRLASLRIGTDNLAPSAIASMASTAKGVLLPRMTTAQRSGIQNPGSGLTIFNLDSLCYQVYLNVKGWDDYCHRQQLHSLVVGSDILDPSAILGISATDKGVLFPRMTTAQRDDIQGKVLALTVFNTDSACYEVYLGVDQPKWSDSKGWDDYCVQTYYDSLLIGQGSLSPSAVLEVRSTSKGVLFPRMTTAQRNGIQDPESGLTIFNLDSLCYEVCLRGAVQPLWDDYCKRKDLRLASLRIGTDNLAPSAIVSIASTAKGVLLPRMTTAQRNGIQNLGSGLTIFNLDSLCYQVYINVKGWDDYCHRQQLHSLAVGSDSLDPSATLDVSSTAKGFLFPRVTTAQRDDIQGKILALTVFNTDSACYEVYLGVDQPKWSDSKGWDDYCVQTYYDSLLIGQGSLSPSAVLEVRSTSKGVLFPRMTTAQRNGIQNPESGLTIFNLDSLCYEVYRGTAAQPPWDDYCKRKDPRLASLRIGTAGLASSAIASIASTAKGVLLPRMTTAQRNGIQNPESGLTIFNLDSLCYEVYVGNAVSRADSKGWDDYCHRTQLDSLKVGVGTLDRNAILDIASTERGILLPHMTTEERDSIAQGGRKPKGLMIYNLTTHCHEYYSNTGDRAEDSKGWRSYCSQKIFNSLLIGANKLTPGAILEVQSSDKGVLIPSMSKSMRDAMNPAQDAVGLMIYNTTSQCHEIFLGLSSGKDVDNQGWYNYCNQNHYDFVKVGTGPAVDAALLSIQSTTQGALLPRMTTVQRNDNITNPVVGLTIFNLTIHCYQAFVGKGQRHADSAGWDNYCVQNHFDSLLISSGTLPPSAILAVQSSSQGVLLPRMSTAQRDKIAVDTAQSIGLTIFNTDSLCYQIYTGSTANNQPKWDEYCNKSQQPSLIVTTSGGNHSPSSILSVYSHNKGVLFPRMTTAQIRNIKNPAYGLMVYNTTKHCQEIYRAATPHAQAGWYDYCTLLPLSVASLKAGGKALSPGASLQFDSDNRGVLLPRMSTAQRDKIAVDSVQSIGLMIFNTDSLCYQVYTGSTPGNQPKWDDYCNKTRVETVGVGVDNLSSSAILEIVSDGEGALFPRMTTAQRNNNITNPAVGLTIFNITTQCYEVFVGVGTPHGGPQGWDNYCIEDHIDSLLLGSGSLDSSAILQVNSEDKGLLLPRMTTVQRDAIPVDQGQPIGLTIFNTDSLCYEVYTGKDKNDKPKWDNYCARTKLNFLKVGADSLSSGAIMQVDASDRGVLLPRMTTAQRDSIAVDSVQSIGLMIFNTDSLCYEVYIGKGKNDKPKWDNYCERSRFNSVAIGVDKPASSAILEIASTTKGVLLPRMTTAQRDSIAVDTTQSIGLTIFNTDSLCYEVYIGKDASDQPKWDNYCKRKQRDFLIIGVDKPASSAILEIASTTKGVLLPRMTTAQRDSIAVDTTQSIGLTIFNTDSLCYEVYIGKDASDQPKWDNYCKRTQLNSLLVGGGTLSPSAILQVNATAQGVLLPRMTTVQRNAINLDTAQSIGLMVFNTDTHCYETFLGVTHPKTDRLGWYNYCEYTRFDSLKIGPGALEQTALLQISSRDKGVLLPRMNSVQRNNIAGPPVGLMIFNTDTHCHEVYRKTGGWYSYCTQKPIPQIIPQTPDIPQSWKPPGSSRLNPFEGAGCAALQQSYPGISDGEYWFRLRPYERPIKLACAMIEGKAYTLIWSYSEETNEKYYRRIDSFRQVKELALSKEFPRNVVRAFDGKIVYEDFRLNHKSMLELDRENIFFTRTVTDPRAKTRASMGTYAITDLSSLNPDSATGLRCNFIEGNTSTCTRLRLQTDNRVQIRGCLQGKKLTQLYPGDPDPNKKAVYTAPSGTGGTKKFKLYWIIIESLSPNTLSYDVNADGVALQDRKPSTGYFGLEYSYDYRSGLFGVCQPARLEDGACNAEYLQVQKNINNGQGNYMQWFVR